MNLDLIRLISNENNEGDPVELLARLRRGRLGHPGELVASGFLEGLEEALRGGADPAAVALEVGASAATQGSPWPEILTEVEALCQAVTHADPAYDLVKALSTGWAEACLQHLHGLSCEDPLSGLTSLAHLSTRLDEVYRGADRDGVDVPDRHAFVVVELPASAGGTSPLRTSLAMLETSEVLRAVFNGSETIARSHRLRCVALVERTQHLLATPKVVTTLLRTRLRRTGPDDFRVWIEGLPRSRAGASTLLGELAR